MLKARKDPNLPEPYTGITLFADLSKYMMQARSKLVPLTKLYRNHGVVYHWGFPAKLIVTWKGKTHTVFKRDTES